MVERIRPAARPRLLKPAQARAILAGYFDKAQSMRVLADKYGVSHFTISSIVHGRTYRDVYEVWLSRRGFKP